VGGAVGGEVREGGEEVGCVAIGVQGAARGGGEGVDNGGVEDEGLQRGLRMRVVSFVLC
jgi:hypothetical protein